MHYKIYTNNKTHNNKTLTSVKTNAKNTHTCIQHRTLTDNGHLLLKLKEHSLSKTTGFIEYNSLCDKLLHIQFMSLRAPLISKFMLTCKHLQNHPQHSGNTCTMLLSVESLPFQAYTSITLMKTTCQFQKKYLTTSTILHHIITYKHKLNSMMKTHATSHSTMHAPSKNTSTQ